MSHTLKYATLYLGAMVALGFSMNAGHAADKAVAIGEANGVSDLEERIAELEATTAKKGNRKVRLTVSGEINYAILGWDENNILGKSDARIIPNDNFLNFAGAARFSKQLDAGFVIEIGVGRYDVLSDALAVNQSNDVYVRRSAVWLKSPIGKVTLGKDSEATDGIVDGTAVVNTAPAAKLLSFRPLLGGDGITENADLFDGQRLNIVRYDSPTLAGFVASASWSNDGTSTGLTDVTDVYAVALRYFGEFEQTKISAGVGFRKGAVFPGLDPILPLPQVAFDQETVSGSASVLHVPTGLFLNVAAGQAKFDGGGKITSWEVMPGIEERWFALGRTTVFVGYAQFKLDGASEDLSYAQAGIVQAVDGAALSLYATARRVDVAGEEATYGIAGVKIGF